MAVAHWQWQWHNGSGNGNDTTDKVAVEQGQWQWHFGSGIHEGEGPVRKPKDMAHKSTNYALLKDEDGTNSTTIIGRVPQRAMFSHNSHMA